MTDISADSGELAGPAKKSGKMGLIIGLVLAIAGAGGDSMRSRAVSCSPEAAPPADMAPTRGTATGMTTGMATARRNRAAMTHPATDHLHLQCRAIWAFWKSSRFSFR